MYIKLLFVYLSYSCLLLGQEYDKNWVLGYGDVFTRTSNGVWGKFNLSFNPDLDTMPMLGQIKDCEMSFTTSCISDEDGELKFFTDGFNVWGHNYKISQNGNKINPGIMWDRYIGVSYPLQNGAYFLPFPKHKGQYYLFHKGVTFILDFKFKNRISNSFCDKFYYSIVEEDDKSGRVLVKNKILLESNPLDSNSVLINDSEMAACLHGNGTDYWLVIKHMGTNEHFLYLLDSTGIRLQHRQKIGVAKSWNDWNGNSVFSNDGKYFARTLPEDGLEVFEFDRCRGIFFNPRHVVFPDTDITVSSVAISSNSRFVYLTSLNAIWQYDLYESNLESSKVMVGKWDSIWSPIDSQMYYLGFYQARLAPDNKIYIAYFGGNHYLHRINNPDEKGIACNSENYAVLLPAYMSGSLPMFPNFRLGSLPDCVSKLKEVNLDEDIDDFTIVDKIEILSIQGQLIISYNNTSINNILQNNIIPYGIYYIVCNSQNGKRVIKKINILK